MAKEMKPVSAAASIRAIPVLMRDSDVISLKQAAFRTGRSEKTIAGWCVEAGIGRRSAQSGPWEISAVALEAKRYGYDKAIEDLRRGDFLSVRARRYSDYLGIGAGSNDLESPVFPLWISRHGLGLGYGAASGR